MLDVMLAFAAFMAAGLLLALGTLIAYRIMRLKAELGQIDEELEGWIEGLKDE